MKLEPFKPYIIGLDPGKHTGIALWRRKDEKIIYSGTSDFYAVQMFIVKTFPDNRRKPGSDGINHKTEVKIFVEQPKTMLYKRNESDIRNEELRIMWSAGGNYREAQILAMCLKERGYEVESVPPILEPKWDQRRWTLFTGSNKRTSDHERDATRLAVVNANKRKYI